MSTELRVKTRNYLGVNGREVYWRNPQQHGCSKANTGWTCSICAHFEVDCICANPAPASRPNESQVTTTAIRNCFLCDRPVTVECRPKLDDDRAPRPHYVYTIECECGVQLAEWSNRWTSGNLEEETSEDHEARQRLITKWNSRPNFDVLRDALQTACDTIINLTCLDTKDARAAKFHAQADKAINQADAALKLTGDTK